MKLRTILIITGLSTMLACKNTGTVTPTVSTPQMLSSFPESGSNLRISLTDAPSDELKNVFVNVDHAELFVRGAAGDGRLVVAQNLGLIDLMTLRNGVLLPLQDLNLASGIEITGIRLVLKGDNNHAIKSDDSRCEMQTPSGQQSGIKINLAQTFTLENSSTYSMVLDFDAKNSVVILGTGECLLKPVLKLLQVAKTPLNSSTAGSSSGDNTSSDNVIAPVTDGTDSNGGSDPTNGGDFEIPLDPVDELPVITSEDSFTLI